MKVTGTVRLGNSMGIGNSVFLLFPLRWTRICRNTPEDNIMHLVGHLCPAHGDT